MQDIEKLGAFYLGRLYDTSARQTSAEAVLYDSKDLVTHAVCVGMTGSGKTGLCVDLLEEAAIDGIPSIVIDPKGDIGNLLLQFPDLTPEDFAPWVNEDDAKREGLSPAQFAGAQADLWRNGLAKWGQNGERIRRLQSAADFTIYTPGSTAGVPISLLKSFAAPDASVAEDRELLRDRISGAATALLSLMGIEAEPMKSREHILLSNIFDNAWKNREDLTIEGLIHAIQAPPITRIGVLDLEAFYPAKDRFELSMALNNLLASPGFEAWLEGEPLDIGKLLYTPDGRPRVAILSISHLTDSERMFFVTLVLNEVLSWTRRQSGTTSLRAILYMDEIFGYFPPISNPPSKRPLLTLLKQARAFGVGVVLATQNPVDLDYKGLANAGTWFIGRLQTERDKQRLIEGLEGAASEGSHKFDRARTEEILAGLGKRVFLMNNVHEDAPIAFESRWALAYLRGPLTRTQIKTLMSGRKADSAAAMTAAAPKARPAAAQRTVLPPEIPQKFIPARATGSEVVYQPVILGAAQVRFLDTKAKVDYVEDFVLAAPIRDDGMPVEWEECFQIEVAPSDLENEPVAGAEYAPLPADAGKPKSYTRWSKDLVNWIYANRKLDLHSSPGSKECSQPGETEGAFRARLQHSGREQRDAAIEKLRQKYATKVTTLQERLRRAEQAVTKEKEQRSTSLLSVGADIFGVVFGRKKATSAIGSVSRTYRDSADIGRAEENVEAVKRQLEDLQAQIEAEVAEIQSRMDATTAALETIAIKPKKANINVRLFTLAWAPYTKDASGELKPVF
jgi:DNA helicase HerA-like ATPase/prefoldin subunit 5